jgi:hypothetical protein
MPAFSPYKVNKLQNEKLVNFIVNSSVKLIEAIGTMVSESGEFLMGMYPSMPLSPHIDSHVTRTIIHEMSHLIEVEDHKLFLKNYGLPFSDETGESLHNFKISYTYPSYGSEKINKVNVTINHLKGSRREFRVLGIQTLLYEYFGVEHDIEVFFNTQLTLDSTPSAHEKQLKRHVYIEMLRLAKKAVEDNNYTIEKLLNEWDRKNELIRVHSEQEHTKYVEKYMGIGI